MITRFHGLFWILFVTTLVGCGHSVIAGEFFVAPRGDDKADGASPKTVWQTIQRGVEALKPGDTLTIAPGVYAESVMVKASGTAEQPIVIRARRR